jgi:hypothetical protein
LQELARRGIKAAIFEGESDPPVGQSA